MSSLKLNGSTSGYVEIVPPAVAGNNSVTLPTTAGSIAVKDASGNLEVGTGVTIAAPSSNTFTVSTNGSERVRVDSSGRFGLGTSSPTFAASRNGLTLRANSSNGIEFLLQSTSATDGGITGYATAAVGNDVYHVNRLDGFFSWTTGSSGNTERMRLDSSGRLLVGTNSARSNLYTNAASYTPPVQFEGNTNTWGNGVSVLNYSASGYGANFALGLSLSNTRGTNALVTGGETCGNFQFLANDGTNFYPIAEIRGITDTTTSTGDVPGRLTFSTTADGATSPTERMKIGSNGRLFQISTSDSHYTYTTQGASTDNAFYVAHHSASGYSGTMSYVVYTNGNVRNTNGSYTSLSDAKLKENIVDANSQWEDIKAIRIRNWNFKEETGHETHQQIGPVAQELEQVCPGLVFDMPDRDEDDNKTGEVTKGVNQSVLYMKAVKALQEAMERIETLESKVASLEA